MFVNRCWIQKVLEDYCAVLFSACDYTCIESNIIYHFSVVLYIKVQYGTGNTERMFPRIFLLILCTLCSAKPAEEKHCLFTKGISVFVFACAFLTGFKRPGCVGDDDVTDFHVLSRI